MFGTGRYKSATPQEVHNRSDVQFLDVREHDEWRAGHIEGALHIPMSLIAQRIDELDQHRPVVAVCRSGQRSGRVVEHLATRGYDATNLDGGLQAWVRAGLPLVSPDGTSGKVR